MKRILSVKWSSSHRRRDSGEMTKSSDEDGREVAKISVSTGTIGGGAPAASDDDPPDKETFQVKIGIDNQSLKVRVLFDNGHSYG